MISKLIKISYSTIGATALLAGFLTLAGCSGQSPPSIPPPTSPSPPATPTHHIGGSVTGLVGGQSAVLGVLNAGSLTNVTITADGGYSFPVALAENSTYAVSISQQPTQQQCTLSNPSGTVGTADVSNINLDCVYLPTVGGTLTGLSAGASVSLANGSDKLVLNADGAFTFAQRHHPGDTYSVTIDLQPTGESCSITNPSGSFPHGNVTNVSVACAVPGPKQANVSLYIGEMGGAGQADGTGSNARFRSPGGVVADPVTGTLWVADSSNRAIRRIDANGAVTTFAGTLGVGGSVDGQGAAARFLSPTGITRDGTGNLYVTDTQMHVIRKITPDGTVTTLAGFAGLSGSADGTGSTARFKNPSGIAAMSDGTLFVADGANYTIRKITSQGVVTTIAGVVGTFGHDDTFGGQPATFFFPSGIAVTSAGVVFVADSGNHIIRSISPAGIVTTVAGTPQSVGYRDGLASQALFDNPANLAYSESSATLYITDSINGVVRSLTGNTVTTFAGNPVQRQPIDGDHNTARMHLPIGLAMTSATTLFITENNFHTVRKIAPDGSITTIAGQARAWQFDSADGVGGAARFVFPHAITAVANQRDTLWITDSAQHIVREITQAPTPIGATPLGSVVTFAGQPGVSGNNWASQPAMNLPTLFNGPSGISANGLVADTNNNIIARFDALRAASLFDGVPPPASPALVDGDATTARFGAPSGLSDGLHFTYVADLFNHAIRQIAHVDGVVSTLAGDGHQGSTDGNAARFNHPQSVLYVSDGVIVADTDNHSIRKVLFAGGTITLAGKSGEFGTIDGDAANARFKSPTALAADALGNVYIADSGNFTIRKLTPAGVVSTLAGQVGVEGFTPGDIGVLSSIRGLAIGTDGALYATMYQGVARIELP